jgi:perosamine synthetase
MRENQGVAMSGEVYALPLHRQPIFAGISEGRFPVADDICGRHVCLPVHSDMDLDEASYVLDSFRTVLSETSAAVRSTTS